MLQGSSKDAQHGGGGCSKAGFLPDDRERARVGGPGAIPRPQAAGHRDLRHGFVSWRDSRARARHTWL